MRTRIAGGLFVSHLRSETDLKSQKYIRQRIEALPEAQVQLLYTLSFQDPTMMLVISLFGGSLGIDRFILGHVGLGVGKLLTCDGCGIWTIVDWFLIMDATRQANAQKLYSLIG